MDVQIYGIKNCDTMKKAFQLFEREKVEYQFLDYKKMAPDKSLLIHFLERVSLEDLINKRGTTYRNLKDEDKELLKSPDTAIPLLISHSSMIKRPIIQFPTGEILIGLNEKEILERMKYW